MFSGVSYRRDRQGNLCERIGGFGVRFWAGSLHLKEWAGHDVEPVMTMVLQ